MDLHRNTYTAILHRCAWECITGRNIVATEWRIERSTKHTVTRKLTLDRFQLCRYSVQVRLGLRPVLYGTCSLEQVQHKEEAEIDFRCLQNSPEWCRISYQPFHRKLADERNVGESMHVPEMRCIRLLQFPGREDPLYLGGQRRRGCPLKIWGSRTS